MILYAHGTFRRQIKYHRSMQKYLLEGQGLGAVSKDDKSPVTIADFAVQALVIYYLSEAFPSDRFIAEESSELIRGDKVCSYMCM
jgi:3'(2'), 5'-bisphosphate nucleotidase